MRGYNSIPLWIRIILCSTIAPVLVFGTFYIEKQSPGAIEKFFALVFLIAMALGVGAALNKLFESV